MARTPLLQLTDISLTFGGAPLFGELDLVVQPGDRVALVGRNGSGKSTLMKVMAGLVEPDRGGRVLAPGLTLGYLEQDPDLDGFETLGDFAASRLPPGEDYRVERVAEGLKLDTSRPVRTASGGERRRAALAGLLAQEPGLMLLDEPTNHLDIEAIEWLERYLSSARAGFVVISHDRAFLRALTRATLWVDRGQVRRQDRGFDRFETWRDKVWDEEDQARHKLNRKIKAEARWAVEGISARRKRNMGRVRALQDLRATRAAMVRRQGAAALDLASGAQSGKLVIEARAISKAHDKPIISDFSIRVARGECIALVGPNGVGKTTLLNLLTGQATPDSGTVRLGSNVEMAVFDQNRAQLDPDASLWDSLALDPEMRVMGQSDQIMVRGRPRHVVSYLKDFLFDELQARAPVRSLSGGEKARLLLARIMARHSNLLVLDEPTNDLDVETLDLLQDLLAEFDGTTLLVSHDRDFIDRVATRSIVLTGAGGFVIHAGGYSDYVAAETGKGSAPKAVTADKSVRKKGQARSARSAPATPRTGLSFTQKHRLDALPDEIARLEAEIARLEQLMSDPELYTREPVKFQKATQALVERQQKLSAAEDEWLELEEKSGA